MALLRPQSDLILDVQQRLLPGSADAARLALTTILRRKGRILDAAAESQAALRHADSPDDKLLLDEIVAIQTEIVNLILRGPGSETPEKHRAVIQKLREQKERLEAEESRISAKHRASATFITPRDVAAALPAGAALVEIAAYSPSAGAPPGKGSLRPHYAAYVLRRDAEIRSVDLGEVAPLDDLIAEARRALSGTRVDPTALSRALHDAVMRPLRAALRDTRWILLSPDGDLNLVPFGALIDEHGRVLIEDLSFTYLTSGRDLLLHLTIDEPATPGPAAVLFGDPDFGVKKAGPRRFAEREGEAPARGARSVDMHLVKFRRLPATAGEIEAVHRRLPAAKVFTSGDATEANLKAVAHPRVLHLATHGFFLPDQTQPGGAGAALDGPLLRSGIALAGANRMRSGEEDGVLTALEAAGLDLYGTKLVVLSACETGVGEARSGEGVYGLRRAFAVAGAETLVMSLWQVDDDATRDLMVGYYDGLARGGGRVEALRQAALALKRQPRYSLPYYWAGFIVSGDGSSLSGEEVAPAPPPVAPVAPGPRGCACAMAGEAGAGHRAALLLLSLAGAATARRARRRRSP
jgi:MYXO-CTERM domain-containing protein